MRTRFPCYESSFLSLCSVHEAIYRISDVSAIQGDYILINKLSCCGGAKIILSVNTYGYLYYNSFLPIVTIEMEEAGTQTHVHVLFELKKSTRLLVSLILLIALLFILAFLGLSITNQLVNNWLFLFPLGFAVFIYLLCSIGLLLSSKSALGVIHKILARGDSEDLPPICRFSQFK